ncbi:MAG: phosphomethylpyrimidine synthase [Nitrospirae bacterium CG_4_10_14_0_8_um_filter_41_23]|nr:phosphomethylpyrimidine synthase ThiC [Nitrospirota bacterium]OIP59972.1 MAG: phosphomethylpyrimidine synthase [Nitrospirae bacterium CG2_30_41_42]PIQ93850.1 MAG: phosphomethylpyrimidine synthase [Nitrospirae bacterium CG11_big_fil_rev_8_21_14_0_20_41_14]PIV40947.1 MAG: phosphomethylpyrimidine synthase [Nitrospirae bacterium CG02_land_8_20_14_3_00_41_53]PIW87048.1 MAG: phosphomethylpyrimidine synthase [Nitrospirae bacterium CG_4_8_14_3_um_filter_41_47]PIY86724.1 MAG: phosphomethylpyrimidine
MTRIELAKKGIITDEMKGTALSEGITPERLAADIAEGLTVIPMNINHNIKPIGIGRGLRTKVNANIGTSKDKVSFDDEMEKLDVLVKYGADAVMDLSTGGPIKDLRRLLLSKSPITVGTVPIYEAAVIAVENYGRISKMTTDDLFHVIENHAEEGVDFVTVHCGLTRKAIERLRDEGRILDIVSRGGSFLLEWMVYNDKENPLYEHYDRLLEIAKRYDVTLSLGDGLRPGCLEDATDRSQIEELLTIGELRDRALESEVQAIIEGPGHVPLNQVEMNIKIQKEICKGAPFYVLGPLVTDIAMGYDHIAAAIGGAIAGAAGADFLCYVTPAEHIRLPNIEDVKEGLIASKIAAHAADIAKGIPGAIELDRKMARFRKNLDWNGQIELSFDPEKVRQRRSEIPPREQEVCSMCGEFCAIRTVERALRKNK